MRYRDGFERSCTAMAGFSRLNYLDVYGQRTRARKQHALCLRRLTYEVPVSERIRNDGLHVFRVPRLSSPNKSCPFTLDAPQYYAQQITPLGSLGMMYDWVVGDESCMYKVAAHTVREAPVPPK